MARNTLEQRGVFRVIFGLQSEKTFQKCATEMTRREITVSGAGLGIAHLVCRLCGLVTAW